MAEKRPSLKARLSRLEAELDELIRLQEGKKSKQVEHVNSSYNGPNCHQFQQCQSINVTTRSKTMISNHRPCCIHDPGTSAPLNDISKFLQHINLNISKGTQAIAKLATSASQETAERGADRKICNNTGNCVVKPEQDIPNVWRPPGEKKVNEDGLFKELREEKDKRMRAENQVKYLKDELKKTKSEFQQNAESTIRMLQDELKDTLEKLNKAECEMQRRNEEFRSAEYLWPLKYETVNRELQEEKQKRKHADENNRQLQESLRKLFIDTEEHLTLQKTANWIKTQNENLLCLTKKLKVEIESKNGEICGNKRCIQDNLQRIKQLTCLCGKLRDVLVVTRGKLTNTEDKLKMTMEHCQKLSEKMLQDNRHMYDQQKCIEESKNEHTRLSELLRCTELKNSSLQSRIEEMSEMMKKQNDLIGRQSTTIDNKDEQLKLAHENIKLQSQRLADLENKISDFQKSKEATYKSFRQNEFSQLLLDLENEKENVMIKDKIIESHLNSIAEKKSDLARKESEINQLKRDLSNCERRLSIEQTTNKELISKNKQLQSRKDELKRKIEDLEEELSESTEQTIKLEYIEKQIQLKQNEWEELRSKLSKEKDEAIDEVKRLMQKLADKTADFQIELENKQRTVDYLNSQIRERDSQIQEAKCEIMQLAKQLQEVKEQGEATKKRFEEAFQAALNHVTKQ